MNGHLGRMRWTPIGHTTSLRRTVATFPRRQSGAR